MLVEAGTGTGSGVELPSFQLFELEEPVVGEDRKSRQSATVLVVFSTALIATGVVSFFLDFLKYYGGTTIGIGVGGLVYALIVRQRHGGLLDIDREASEVRRAAHPALVAGLLVAVALVAIEVVAR